MMSEVEPGLSFEVLVDEDRRAGLELPDDMATVLGARWSVPTVDDLPYVYVNFVVSRDGRISFAVPGHVGGGDVSRGSAHDRWLMALSRARADAVLVGDGTLRAEPEHLWTPGYIWPEDTTAFADMRRAENRAVVPTTVILSLNGDLPPQASVLRSTGPVVVLTTELGREPALLATKGAVAPVEVVVFGTENGVDLVAGLRQLRARGVRTLLCEGGPTVYGSMLAANLVDDELLCLSPVMIGASADQRRPGLVEGVAFGPGTPPVSRILSLLRAGDHLFLRSTYRVSQNTLSQSDMVGAT